MNSTKNSQQRPRINLGGQISSFHSLVSQAVGNSNNQIKLSLTDLKKMQSIKVLLEQFQELNIIYKENTSMGKKLKQKQTIEQKQENLFYEQMNLKIKEFLKIIKSKIEKLRIQLVNNKLNQDTAIKFLRDLILLIIKSADFTIVLQANDTFQLFSTIKEIMQNQPSEEQLQEFLLKTQPQSKSELQKKATFSCERLVLSANKLKLENESKQKRPQMLSSPKIEESNQKQINLLKQIWPSFSPAENEKLLVMNFFEGNDFDRALVILHNIVKSDEQLIYKSINDESLALMSELLISSVIDIINNNVFSKKTMTDLLQRIKQSLIYSAKQICQEIIKKELYTITKSKINIIREDSEMFEIYKNHMQRKKGFCEGQKVVIPIFDNQRVDFFLTIENFSFDLFTFIDRVQSKYGEILNTLNMLSQRDQFFKLLELDSTKLLLAFNKKRKLIYQNKEIPINLKFFFYIGYIKLKIKRTYIQITKKCMNENDGILQITTNKEFQEEIELGINQVSDYEQSTYSSTSSPAFELVAQKESGDAVQGYLLVISNQRTQKLNLFQSQASIPLGGESNNIEKEKLQKYIDMIDKYYGINGKFTVDKLVKIMKERAIQKNVEENAKEKINEYNRYEDFVKNEANFIRRKTGKGGSRKFSIAITQLQVNTRKSASGFSIVKEEQESMPSPQIPMNKLITRTTDAVELKSWDFNVLELKNPEKIRFVFSMFSILGFVKTYEINTLTFELFLEVLQQKYNSRGNPYHNWDHAFTVTHGIMYLLSQYTKMNFYLNELEQFSLLLSAICHDVDHTGRTNIFEISKYSKVSLRYNDESVLENHHSAVSFKILCNEKYNILAELPEDNFRILRKQVIQNILSTDMKLHFELQKAFDLQQKDLININDYSKITDAQKKLIAGSLIHCFDIYSGTKQTDIAIQWSQRINQEFICQVQEEEKLGLPLTQYMVGVEQKHILAKGEMNFIKFIQQPFWTVVNNFVENFFGFCIENLEKNISHWEAIYKDYMAAQEKQENKENC